MFLVYGALKGILGAFCITLNKKAKTKFFVDLNFFIRFLDFLLILLPVGLLSSCLGYGIYWVCSKVFVWSY